MNLHEESRVRSTSHHPFSCTDRFLVSRTPIKHQHRSLPTKNPEFPAFDATQFPPRMLKSVGFAVEAAVVPQFHRPVHHGSVHHAVLMDLPVGEAGGRVGFPAAVDGICSSKDNDIQIEFKHIIVIKTSSAAKALFPNVFLQIIVFLYVYFIITICFFWRAPSHRSSFHCCFDEATPGRSHPGSSFSQAGLTSQAFQSYQWRLGRSGSWAVGTSEPTGPTTLK